jgi:hypothetical protein
MEIGIYVFCGLVLFIMWLVAWLSIIDMHKIMKEINNQLKILSSQKRT